jgi:hypothetical protein
MLASRLKEEESEEDQVMTKMFMEWSKDWSCKSGSYCEYVLKKKECALMRIFKTSTQ